MQAASNWRKSMLHGACVQQLTSRGYYDNDDDDDNSNKNWYNNADHIKGSKPR